MRNNAEGQGLSFNLPRWVRVTFFAIVAVLAIFTAMVIVFTLTVISKKTYFYDSYAQTRTEIIDTIGLQGHADIALDLFDRAVKCPRREGQRMSSSLSWLGWAVTPGAEFESLGRQAAKDCFQFQINMLEVAQNSDLIEKMRAAAR